MDPGHVIAHNAIAYFHDASASLRWYPREDPHRRASSIDIYGNDMHLFNDDFVETDGGVHNIRVFRNRGVNAAHGGFSSQPVFGGPALLFPQPSLQRADGCCVQFTSKPAGLFVYHNTLIAEQTTRQSYSNVHYRNNLFLGRDAADRGIMTWANATGNYSSDFNGFRPNKGVAAQYSWLAPGPGGVAYERPNKTGRLTGLLKHFERQRVKNYMAAK
jgi:hypothetical protein